MRTGEVGLLHSITGDLSRLERMAVNAERMAIQEINDVGGLLGMKIVPVIADGESDPDVRIRFLICFHMFSLESFLILSS